MQATAACATSARQKKVAERRHKAERRLPELTDLPYEEFEAELAALGKQASVFLRSFSSGQ
ncbi:hypothetical protein E4Q23_08825 [Candidatus Accumulibacter phosphatis]|uniref:DUF3563 domain-containing protein n=1 Tax=Candidatus Accumulibacter phosphatis TaxID=327160 RepID=A0ABX1TXQ5_9PROT|nr:hypothetical protein [Candidatus Accumulibacter phosphatis]NMQ27849.1 hypothetical protein [Candidatus Accumulibacter phosphatis]